MTQVLASRSCGPRRGCTRVAMAPAASEQIRQREAEHRRGRQGNAVRVSGRRGERDEPEHGRRPRQERASQRARPTHFTPIGRHNGQPVESCDDAAWDHQRRDEVTGHHQCRDDRQQRTDHHRHEPLGTVRDLSAGLVGAFDLRRQSCREREDAAGVGGVSRQEATRGLMPKGLTFPLRREGAPERLRRSSSNGSVRRRSVRPPGEGPDPPAGCRAPA